MTQPARRRYLGIPAIMRRLPHRYPFLMIDRVTDAGPEHATAIKNVTVDEPFFVGHFPTEPMLPGMLIGEAMAQTAAFIGMDLDCPDGSLGAKAMLTSIALRLDHPVIPGDQLVLTAKLIKRLGPLSKVSTQATVDGLVVARAELTVATAGEEKA